ncbi:putative acetyltransferase, GNAT family [Streptoalloteichus tenebrarius]|uniref:Acetyltransferase, GNAT family n=1 Tax=Streptoalloteichus tenebrarius (strain ATCC 17920 / DSM 40477 / JCM 4838 / CBS 697.72 / NBRC 16177 / NCIMB 11028 / NRRL B-12390 / A12253. 1 / ISP 5477) TaxID=1933 RepID=A0ABT1HML2_STRSD|nr:putative acetyltransferase, GNAT family [Streptoalloteichus tenebrarius]
MTCRTGTGPGCVVSADHQTGRMVWHTSSDLREHVANADAFLRERPTENTVLLTVAATLRERGHHAYGTVDPLFGWCRSSGGEVVGAFLHTPPRGVLLSHMPVEAARALPDELAALGRRFGEIHGHAPLVEAFTARQREIAGAPRLMRHERLYRLGELAWPSPAPAGSARRARPGDRAALVSWHDAFAREIGDPESVATVAVDYRIGYGGLLVWEVDGVATSMAGVSRPIADMARIGPVYTPPEFRGRGYAGAVTAAASEVARQAGAREVLLFADMANPTSNGLYQRLGFRAAGDYLVMAFD